MFRIAAVLRRLAFLFPSLLPTLAFAMLYKGTYSVSEIVALGADIALTASTLALLLYGAAVFSRAVDLKAEAEDARPKALERG